MQDRETDEKNPEFHISLTPVKVDGYTQWHVNIKAQRSDSDCAVLVNTSVPFLYPNAVDVIREIISHQDGPRFG